MGIYRGPGGTGDATTDSSSQAIAAVNAASAASTSQTAAASSASAASASATSAASSASTASTQATNASNSAGAAATSESNASNSASSASSSASTASTQAGVATTKASEASTSATNAATSATNASTSASNASSSATSAANAQSAAETARDQTLAAFDSFDDRYLGQKSTAPTVDNDGNALVAGALYFNTTTNEMKVWDGSQWLNAYASLSGALLATNNLSDLNNAATARTNLGVAIGTNVQAYDADLGAIAALSGTTGLLKKTAANTWALDTTAYSTGTVTSVAAITLTTTGTDLSSSVATNTTTPVITLNVPTASATNRGALSSADWTTFNGKYSTGGALGTPSSGTLTNCTGYTYANLSGTVPTWNQNTTGTSAGVSGSQTANYIYAAPNGTAGTATFRAMLAADVPTLNQNTTGSSGSCTGNAATSTTATTANALNTANNYQVNSLGVGTAGSATAGEIRATNNITAYYSSDRTLKENIKEVESALGIVCSIGSKTFDWTDNYIEAKGGEDGYFIQKSDFGVIAQDVQEVFPQAVRTREDGTLAVDYEKLSTLAFGAIKELVKRIEKLENN